MRVFRKSFNFKLFFLLMILFSIFTFANTDKNKKIVEDIDGNKIAVNKNIKRIVSLDAFTTQLLLTLQENDNLVAINYGKLVSKDILFKYFKNIKNRSTIFTGKNINIEELIKLQPDIIISKKGYYYLKQIENYDFPVFLIDVETPEKFFKSIELLGKALDREKRALVVTNYLKSLINEIESRSVNIKHKYKAYFAGGNILSSYGNQAFQKYIADFAKLSFVSKNIDKFKIKIDPEQLIKWDPEVILLPKYCKTSIDEIKNNPVFKELNAVKNNRIYRIPSFFLSWDLPEPEAFLSIYWIYSKVYNSDPENIKIELRNKMKEFYLKLYGIKILQKDVEHLISEYF